MNTVERIKAICKERNIPISRIEKDLEFGNGYFTGLKKGVLPDDRLQKVAEYLVLSVDYLMTGKEPADDKYSPEYAFLIGKIRNDTELSKALPKYFELSDAKKKYIIGLIDLLSE